MQILQQTVQRLADSGADQSDRYETFGCRGPHDAQINCSEYFSFPVSQ